MVNAILIGDEQVSLQALCIQINQVSEQIQVLQCFQSLVDTWTTFEELNPDVVFLDFHLSDRGGFSLLQQLPSRSEVILITPYIEYAVQAIQYRALEFLLKPVTFHELQEAIARLLIKLQAKTKPVISQTSPNVLLGKIPVTSVRGTRFLPIESIVALTADGNYTTLHLIDKSKIVSSKKIGYYEEVLAELYFLRIHHSSLINLNHVQEYLKGGNAGTVIMTDGTELDIAKRRKKAFLEAIGC